MNSKRQAEEEKRARMQSTNAAAMAMINLRPTKQAAQTVSPETPNANPSTPATSGDQNEDASGDAMTDEDQMTNRTNGRYTGVSTTYPINTLIYSPSLLPHRNVQAVS